MFPKSQDSLTKEILINEVKKASESSLAVIRTRIARISLQAGMRYRPTSSSFKGTHWWVHNIACPISTSPRKWRRTSTSCACGSVVLEHRAWVSVDAMHDEGEESISVHRPTGGFAWWIRICLALYSPTTINRHLRSGHGGDAPRPQPLEVFEPNPFVRSRRSRKIIRTSRPHPRRRSGAGRNYVEPFKNASRIQVFLGQSAFSRTARYEFM